MCVCVCEYDCVCMFVSVWKIPALCFCLPCAFCFLSCVPLFRLLAGSSFFIWSRRRSKIMILNLFWFLSTIVLFFWREILFYVYCLSSSRVGNPIAIGMYQHTVPALNTSMYVPMCVCLLFLVFTLWYDAECSPLSFHSALGTSRA